MWDRGIILNDVARPNMITWDLKQLFLTVVSEREVMTEASSERCYVTGLENGGRKSQAKKWGWILEAGKHKEMDSFPEIPDSNAALPAARL